MLAPTFRHASRSPLDLGERLQRTPLFAALTEQQTQKLASQSIVRSLPDKAPLTLPSASSRSIHLLLEGRLKVCSLTRDGKQPILYFVDADELVGEQLIFSEEDTEYYVETMQPTTVATIPTGELRALVLTDPSFSASVSELVSRRRHQVESRLRRLLFLSNHERLAHLLLDLADQYGTRIANRVELGIKLSHQDLANFIGSTRETVTVVLGKMQLSGLVQVKRRRIALMDIVRLAQDVDRKLPRYLQPGAQPLPR